jgi:hypothetical protein
LMLLYKGREWWSCRSRGDSGIVLGEGGGEDVRGSY